MTTAAHAACDLFDPPAPEVLARQLGTHEKRLNEAFSQTFAMPVFTWVREQRWRTSPTPVM